MVHDELWATFWRTWLTNTSTTLRSFSDRYPVHVLLYSAYHNYPKIVDDAAFHVLTSQNLEVCSPKHIDLIGYGFLHAMCQRQAPNWPCSDLYVGQISCSLDEGP